jgi:hypothetical protein
MVWSLAAWVQLAGKVHRIGFPWESPKTFPSALEVFRQELHRLGYLVADVDQI